jgi:hypothetical protein
MVMGREGSAWTTGVFLLTGVAAQEDLIEFNCHDLHKRII